MLRSLGDVGEVRLYRKSHDALPTTCTLAITAVHDQGGTPWTMKAAGGRMVAWNLGPPGAPLDGVWHFRLAICEGDDDHGEVLVDHRLTCCDLLRITSMPLASARFTEPTFPGAAVLLFGADGEWYGSPGLLRALAEVGAVCPRLPPCRHSDPEDRAERDDESAAVQEGRAEAVDNLRRSLVPLLARLEVTTSEKDKVLEALYPFLLTVYAASDGTVSVAERRARVARRAEALRDGEDELAARRRRLAHQWNVLGGMEGRLGSSSAAASAKDAPADHASWNGEAHDLARAVRFRQSSLLLQLRDLFVIRVIRRDKYTICGLQLYSSFELARTHEEEHSSALGHVARVVLQAASILRVRLAYELHFHGSRSSIRASMHHDAPKTLPLYVRGVDAGTFGQAREHLMTNIGQLLEAVGAKEAHPEHGPLPSLELFFLTVRNHHHASKKNSPTRG